MTERRCDKCQSDCTYDGVQRSGEPGVPGYDCATCACGQTRQFELPEDPFERIQRCRQIAVGVARREDIPAGERARLVDDTLQEMAEAFAEVASMSDADWIEDMRKKGQL